MAFWSSRFAGNILFAKGSRTKPVLTAVMPVTGSTVPAVTGRVVAGSKTCPVELICSRLNSGVQNRSCRASQLRTVVVGFDLEFLNGVHWRFHRVTGPVQEIHEVRIVINPVEKVVVLRGPQAVSGETSTVTEATGVLLALGYPSRELRQ